MAYWAFRMDQLVDVLLELLPLRRNVVVRARSEELFDFHDDIVSDSSDGLGAAVLATFTFLALGHAAALCRLLESVSSLVS